MPYELSLWEGNVRRFPEVSPWPFEVLFLGFSPAKGDSQ
jgi:hypothetical protein